MQQNVSEIWAKSVCSSCANATQTSYEVTSKCEDNKQQVQLTENCAQRILEMSVQRHSRSLMPMPIQKLTYDLLLMINNNCDLISQHCRNTGHEGLRLPTTSISVLL